jgi:hypothetical protein
LPGPNVTTPERWGSLSALGIATESTFGTPVSPTTFLPFTTCSINPDPGLFSPEVMMGRRHLDIFRLYGEYKLSGSIDAPLFPNNGIPLLVASIGPDGGRSGQPAGNGVTGSAVSGGFSGTLSSATTAGATSIPYATTGSAPTANTYVQVDVNSSTTTAEVRKITSVTGTTSPYTLQLDTALNFAHASGVTVAQVQAPFTHQLLYANQLDSLTIEKNVGGYQSEQWAGCRVNKLSLKVATGNNAISASADVVAQNVSVLSTPSPIAVVNDSPFVFAEAVITLYGQAFYQATSFTLDIENGLKETYTLAQQHNVQYITPVTLKATGQIQLVFSSLNDTNYGYFSRMFNQAGGSEIPGSVSLTLAHPGGGSSITFNLPTVAISKYADDIKMTDVVLSTLDVTAFLNLGATSPNLLSVTIANSSYLPF